MTQFKVVGYQTGKAHTTELVKALLTPFGGELLPQYAFNTSLQEADLYVISGILRGTGLVFQACVEQKRDFLYMDHAYFNKGYDHPTWMRITKNRHTFGPTLINSSSARFDKHFASKYKMQPWRGGQGKNIIVMPPTHAISWLFRESGWEYNICNAISKFTKRPVIVRGKPNDPIVDYKGDLIRMDSTPDGIPLAEQLKDAYAVVVYNSNAALECLQAGIPVICQNVCAAYPLSFELADLETDRLANEPNRMQLFYDLANSQFTKDEMRQGTLPLEWLGKN